jgi:hypothetical protein
MDLGARGEKPKPAAGLLGGEGLAAWLILANSGGIVGLFAPFGRTRSCASLGLRLAALEVFPQRCGKPRLLPCPRVVLRGLVLGTLCHARWLRHCRPCGKDRGVCG